MITKKTALSIALISTLSTSLWAADSELSSTESIDRSEITLGIGGPGGGGDGGPGLGQILITNMDTIPLGEFAADGGGDLTGSTDFCVYRTGVGDPDSGVTYNLAVSNANDDYALIAEGSGTTISYSVNYFGQPGSGGSPIDILADSFDGNVSAIKNGVLSGEPGSYACSAVNNNARVEVAANFTEASQAETGNYTDTLILTVSPN